MTIAEALVQVGQMLDDVNLIHADAAVGVRMMNRAHQYVHLRFSLTRQTTAIALAANQPLYRLLTVFPRYVRFVSAELVGTGPIWPIPLAALRLTDPDWIATPATASKPPQWCYVYGLTVLGFYPVPIASGTVNLTAVVPPVELITEGARLTVPDAYLPRVIETTAGFLMLSSERAMKQGLFHITRGLALPTKLAA